MNVNYEMSAEEIVEIEFEISISSIKSDPHIIAEVSSNPEENSDHDSEVEENESDKVVLQQLANIGR